jgi:hypothetical protein
MIPSYNKLVVPGGASGELDAFSGFRPTVRVANIPSYQDSCREDGSTSQRPNLQALFCLITPKKGINIAEDCCLDPMTSLLGN